MSTVLGERAGARLVPPLWCEPGDGLLLQQLEELLKGGAAGWGTPVDFSQALSESDLVRLLFIVAGRAWHRCQALEANLRRLEQQQIGVGQLSELNLLNQQVLELKEQVAKLQVQKTDQAVAAFVAGNDAEEAAE